MAEDTSNNTALDTDAEDTGADDTEQHQDDQHQDDHDQDNGADTGANDDTESDADKIVAKLQKRIGKEQSEKNEFKTKYEQALKQLKALQDGKDPNADDDEDDDNTKTIKELQAQIKRRDMQDQARSVITEAGFNVPAALLDALVVDDNDQTLANVKAVIEYTNAIQSDTRAEFRKGHTPRTSGKTASVTKAQFDAMSFAEQMKLGEDSPELFTKLLNQ